jgi:hypothetical protein
VGILTGRILRVKCSIGASEIVEADETRRSARLIEGLTYVLDWYPRERPGVPSDVVSVAQCAAIDFDRIVFACATVNEDARDGEHLRACDLRD